MITDRYHRVHNYLRISLTDRCNLRCAYCMPNEDHAFTAGTNLMQAAEIEAIAKVFTNLGITKIRLTGGEPLVRKDAADIISSLSKQGAQLALTTNGTLLHMFFETLQRANVKQLNISLDTLKSDRFLQITKRDQHARVMKNIHKALEQKFRVKINVVVMRGINDDEINDFIQWTKKTPVHVRFIEFMPFNGNAWNSDRLFTWKEILQVIQEKYYFHPASDEANSTGKSYSLPGHCGSFSVISTMSSCFCASCNRIRLTADGKIKNCLFSKEETDLLTAFRKGEDIRPLILQSIRTKARELGGQFTNDLSTVQAQNIHNRSMITIGG